MKGKTCCCDYSQSTWIREVLPAWPAPGLSRLTSARCVRETTLSYMSRSERLSNAETASEPEAPADVRPESQYEIPAVTYLGTLRDLTRGGTFGPDDGVGGAGGVGSI
jgi:hypothetical protein